jgi:hypothetical protein
MLSNHEFVIAVRDIIYPKVRHLEEDCLELFNKHFTPGRSQTGVRGCNEIDFTIAYLESAARLLRAVGDDMGLIKEKPLQPEAPANIDPYR